MNFLGLNRQLGAFLLASLPWLAAACSSSSESASDHQGGANAPPPASEAPPGDETPVQDDAARAIAEADIVQAAGGRLYAMSRLGSVSVVDISHPGQLTLLGQLRIAGEPFEMYRRGDQLVAMVNGAYMRDGTPCTAMGSTYRPRPTDSGAAVVVIDIVDPAHPRVVDTFPVPGDIADSRMVGDVLYLATYDNGQCWQCGPMPRTLLTSFDLSTRSQLRMVDQLAFASGPLGQNSFTQMPWKRSIVATKDRLYIGGMADSPYPDYPNDTGIGEGLLEVVDVTDPKGALVRSATLPLVGPVLSRWQVDETDGVLRVVTQRGAGVSANGTGMPVIETFKIETPRTFTRLGYGQLQLPMQEGLRAVRFDKERAYAITFRTTDPLFVIDLSNPAAPRQRGEVHMPGYIFHMEPRGNQVLGLGIDSTDPAGPLNVSLLDVQDLDHPTLVQRLAFGPPAQGSRFGGQFLLPEDQDRIQKAFRVIGGGQRTDLVVVPYANGDGAYSVGTRRDACASATGGVQLVDWSHTSSRPLTMRALLPLRGHPRRAFANGEELLTISESNVRAFSLASRDEAVQTADLQIESCPYADGYEHPYDYYYNEGDDTHGGGYFGCSATPGARSQGWIVLAGLLPLWIVRRRRSR
ncbi:beta-propeller domain-containing protein [Pendulispora rubella]|uniref:Beta-propeller domain-containing protein n=1 Tax=Pendulispora rubella TaxID=2741070 RepID=A0ABZ2KX44_9BACT